MFGRMFLHEIRQSWRVPVFLGVVAIVLTLVAKLETHFMDNSFLYYESPGMIRSLAVMFLGFYTLYMIATNVLVFLYIPVRFYRECYSNIGYLTHCLPVTKSVILWAHTLSGAIWMLLYVLIDVTCGFLLFDEDGSVIAEAVRYMFGPMIREIQGVVETTGNAVFIIPVLLLLLALLYPFRQILNGFCAVSLGQVFNKHRIVGAIVMYYVIGFVTGLVNTVFFTIFLYSIDYADRLTTPTQTVWYVIVILAVGLLLMFIETVVFFLISKDRLGRRLNLE